VSGKRLLRVVLDTNVLRGGLRSRRTPDHRYVRMVAEGTILPLATAGLYLEYEEVLLREATLEAVAFTRAEVTEFLSTLAALIEPVRVDYDWRPLLPDPDDDMVAQRGPERRSSVRDLE
jgi:predicted nucleic acid-binding protein